MIAKLLQRWKLYWAERHAIYFELHGHKQLADKHWAIAADIRRGMR
jgi:hypothetical protein